MPSPPAASPPVYAALIVLPDGTVPGVVEPHALEAPTPPLLGTTRMRLLNRATDSRVKDVIKQLYRLGARIGSGSSADKFRRDGSHLKKLHERKTQLERLARDSKLNAADRGIVQELLEDISNALSGR
jgi:hypothetical protein